MLSELKESVTLAAIEFLEVEDVLVECGCFVHVIYLDDHMVAAVNLDAHELPTFLRAVPRKLWHNAGRPRRRHDNGPFSQRGFRTSLRRFRTPGCRPAPARPQA